MLSADSAFIPAVLDFAGSDIVSAHAADIAGSVDGAGVGAAGDGAPILPAHAAGIFYSADFAGVGTVGDDTLFIIDTVVISAHAADIFRSADSAFIAAVLDFSDTRIEPAHAAGVIAGSADGAGVTAACHGAVIIPAHAADVFRSANSAGVGAASDGAALVPAANTAGCFHGGRDGAAVSAVCNTAVIPRTHTGDPVAPAKVGIGHGEVGDLSVTCGHTKQRAVVFSLVMEVQTADSMVLTVKFSCESIGIINIIVVIQLLVRCIADRRPDFECNNRYAIVGQLTRVDGAVLIQHALVDGDVRRQHRVGGGVLLYALQRAVDQPGKPVELAGVADLIDVIVKYGWLIRAAFIHGAEAVGIIAVRMSIRCQCRY